MVKLNSINAVVLLAVAGCAINPITEPPTDNQLVGALRSAGYTIHIMPSSLNSAGALVEFAPDGNSVSWVDDLEGCGVPAEVIGVQRGDFPNFTGTQTTTFGVNLAASLFGGTDLSALAESSRISSMTVNKAGVETFRRLAVANFLVDPANANDIQQYCVDALETRRAAVLVETAYVDEGTFNFDSSASASAALTQDEIEILSEMSGDLAIGTNDEGQMTISSRIYVGYKSSFFVPARIPMSADELISANDELAHALGSID